MIERYVEAVSTYAGSLDALITLIAVITGFWGCGVRTPRTRSA